MALLGLINSFFVVYSIMYYQVCCLYKIYTTENNAPKNPPPARTIAGLGGQIVLEYIVHAGTL